MAKDAFSPITDLAKSWYDKAKAVEDKIENTPPKAVVHDKPLATNWHDNRYDQKPVAKKTPTKSAPRKRTAGK
jgi:hypothetical protein